MKSDDEQKLLLKIVETWNLSEMPEFRGFRCAYCQKYKNEAWYHWLNSGGYKLPIHLCDDACEKAFQNNSIQIDESKRKTVDRKKFSLSYKFNAKAINRFKEIVASWPDYKKPELKAFTCDECGKDLEIDITTDGLRKGFHVWWKMEDGHTLAELHFHPACASHLDISI